MYCGFIVSYNVYKALWAEVPIFGSSEKFLWNHQIMRD